MLIRDLMSKRADPLRDDFLQLTVVEKIHRGRRLLFSKEKCKERLRSYFYEYYFILIYIIYVIYMSITLY